MKQSDLGESQSDLGESQSDLGESLDPNVQSYIAVHISSKQVNKK